MLKLVVCEKPSVAQSISKVLGATKRGDGFLEGGGYIVSWLSLIHIYLLNNFRRLGVSARTLNGKERLHLMHAMFHMGDHDKFYFDWKWLPALSLIHI